MRTNPSMKFLPSLLNPFQAKNSSTGPTDHDASPAFPPKNCQLNQGSWSGWVPWPDKARKHSNYRTETTNERKHSVHHERYFAQTGEPSVFLPWHWICLAHEFSHLGRRQIVKHPSHNRENQSINRSFDQWKQNERIKLGNLSIKQSINQSINRTTVQPHRTNQSINNQSINQAIRFIWQFSRATIENKSIN